MKKILILIILLLVPIKVSAESIELICPSVTSQNANIDCQIKALNSLKGIKLSFSLPNEISTTKITTNWNNHYKANNKGIVVTRTGEDNLNTNITFKISEQAVLGTEYNIGLINIEASDNEHKLLNIEDIYTKVKILSDDNTLSNLTITNGSLSPKFNKNQTTYTSTVKNEKTQITATPSFSKAKVEGDIGEIKLNYGINKINITVTSELGTTKTYSITITRPMPDPPKKTEDKNSKPNTQNNNTKKDNDTTSNNNTYTPSTNTQNTIQKSSDASLKEIKIKDHSIDFDPKKYSYKLKIKNNETDLSITAIPNNSKSHVEIDKPEILEVGQNSIIITVTAEDGTICKYELLVTRAKKEKDKVFNNKTIDTTKEKIKSNKKISIFPSIPLAILIIISILVLLILFIIIKRIFKKDN